MSSFAFALALIAFSPPDDILAPGAKLEKLWGEGAFTEGGALTGDGSILFSDIGDRIMKYDPKSGKVNAFRDPSGRANGMIFDPQGRLIVAEGANTGGKRRVSITDKAGTIRTLADRYQGKKFNSPNDVAVDAKGRVYVSDPRYVGDEPRELDFEAVFRIDPDGTVTRLETTARKPNGLVVSPDGKTLYVADNGPTRKVLLALALDDDGNVSKPRVLVTFEGRGIDGMTVTTDGRIVATAGTGDKAGVNIYKPDGALVGFIPTPEAPSNVEFGGPKRATAIMLQRDALGGTSSNVEYSRWKTSTLYITAGVSLYRIETTMTGHHLWPPRD